MAAKQFGRQQLQPTVQVLADLIATSDDDLIRTATLAFVRIGTAESRDALVRILEAAPIPAVFPGDHP